MNTDDHETADLLRQALHEEAAMVQIDPAALHTIQERTRRSESSRRSWMYAGIGAAAATAAIITGVTVLGDNSDPSSSPGPATQGPTADSTTPPDQSTPTDDAPTAVVGPETEAGTLIYVGPSNHRLYAERAEVPKDDNIATMNQMLATPPHDPDYTSGWPEGVQVDGFRELEHGLVMELSGPVGAAISKDPGLGEDGGELALEALLFNGNFQPGEGVTEVTYNGDPISTPLGVSLPFVLPSFDDVRPFILITNLDDGEQVSSPVDVDVLGNTFEGTVNWQLLDDSGTKVDEGFVTTSMGEWTSATIKLGTLDPGAYTIRCLEYSAENGKVINLDDKTFTVE
jgi:hypothetical protein